MRPVFGFLLKLRKNDFPIDTWKSLYLHINLHTDNSERGIWALLDDTEKIQATWAELDEEQKGKVLPLQIPICRANGSLTSNLWLTSWAAIVASTLRKVQLAWQLQMSPRLQSCSSLLPHKCQLIFFDRFLFKVLNHKGLRKGLVILSFKDICYKIRTYSRSNI